MHGKMRLVAVALAAELTAALTSCVFAEARERKTVTGEPGPRKVIVGTSMYNMFHKYPGLDKRLEELGDFVDQMARRAAKKYPGGRLDIAALPEVAVNGNAKGSASKISVPLEGPVLEAMGAKARQHGCYVVVPLYLVDDREKGLYSNAAVLLDREGKVAGIYRKVFPVASRDKEILEGGVMPGEDFPVFDCDFGRVGIQICYDMAFDEGWDVLGRKGAELVIWTTQSPGQIRPAFRARRHNYFVLTSTWRNNASLLDPTGHRIREIRGPDGVFVEQIDLEYVLLKWQPALRNGRAFDEEYGDRAGYRYSEAEDGGIFWSNDPETPIKQMVRELGLTMPRDSIERARRIQDKLRGGPPSLD